MARLILAIVLLSVAVGCGADEPSRQGGATTTTADPDTGGRPGTFVEIGAGRSLFVHCVGSLKPTVVLEAGFGADASQWQAVQSQIGRGTHVCAYDRVGSGNSVAPPGVQDAREEVADMRAWLARERIDPPYVLAGHSYGGVLARVFAHLHPEETAGLVLIDTIGHDGRRRTLAEWPRSQASRLREYVASTRIGDVDLAVGEAIASSIKTLGDIPLAVIDAGSLAAPRTETAVGHDAVVRQPGELDVSVHVTALRSDHDVCLLTRRSAVRCHQRGAGGRGLRPQRQPPSAMLTHLSRPRRSLQQLNNADGAPANAFALGLNSAARRA